MAVMSLTRGLCTFLSCFNFAELDTSNCVNTKHICCIVIYVKCNCLIIVCKKVCSNVIGMFNKISNNKEIVHSFRCRVASPTAVFRQTSGRWWNDALRFLDISSLLVRVVHVRYVANHCGIKYLNCLFPCILHSLHSRKLCNCCVYIISAL